MGEGPPRGNRHFVSEGALRKAWVRIHAAGFRVRGLGRFRTGRLMELLCLLVGAPQGVPLCICPMQLRSLCFTERPGPAQGLSGPGGLRCLLAIHRWTADGKAAVGVAGPSTPAWRSGLLCLTGTPEPFSAPRRTIFCMSPAGSSRHRHPKAHIPPRRVTPTRCIRRRDEGNVAWRSRKGKRKYEYFPISFLCAEPEVF